MSDLFTLHLGPIPDDLLPEESFAENRPRWAPAPGTIGYWATGITGQADDGFPFVVHDPEQQFPTAVMPIAEKLVDAIGSQAEHLLNVKHNIRVVELTPDGDNTWRPKLMHIQFAVKLYLASDRAWVLNDLTERQASRITEAIDGFDLHPIPDEDDVFPRQRATVVHHVERDRESNGNLYANGGTPSEVVHTFRIAQIVNYDVFRYVAPVTEDEHRKMQNAAAERR